ncbi:uncharacterized protein LOC121802402 isoform X2 [Salvia splendens]|uniref:uncharacterized protein LOC121802402 isoform X2 n=1 Tax=Salvia splendens TaxID=180675 RepID=UPI001C2515B2|nr:uncharacterized protein LOC121802402 isoform X2 [Salvia splendens]XP_042058004.1 uncharacterized protein LOC121802402 isoform X2 [Salvia splendens]
MQKGEGMVVFLLPLEVIADSFPLAITSRLAHSSLWFLLWEQGCPCKKLPAVKNLTHSLHFQAWGDARGSRLLVTGEWVQVDLPFYYKGEESHLDVPGERDGCLGWVRLWGDSQGRFLVWGRHTSSTKSKELLPLQRMMN